MKADGKEEPRLKVQDLSEWENSRLTQCPYSPACKGSFSLQVGQKEAVGDSATPAHEKILQRKSMDGGTRSQIYLGAQTIEIHAQCFCNTHLSCIF